VADRGRRSDATGSPNLKVFAERFVRSIKEECLGKMIFVGQASLRRAIGEYVVHYHGERNHQGLGNALVREQPGVGAIDTRVRRRLRLGGMLNYHYRAAA
jgi:putative transposase